MSKYWFVFLLCLVPMEAQYRDITRRSTCPQPELNNGHARLRQRGRMVRFVCNSYYELVGDKYATCRAGRWDVPPPVCVHTGCTIPTITNAILIPSHEGAWLNMFCYPGYKGSTTMYCDGHRWNGTLPTCVPDTEETQLECNFESPDLCGWIQDERHDFDWTRINKKTPSAFLFTGPAFDHTYGEGKSGHFMFIESSSKSENDTARLISPVYSGIFEKYGCFSFFYHMYGKSTGGLRVYQIPESRKSQILNENDAKNQYLLFEKWGNQGDTWYRNVSKLRDVSDNFQIVIEGIRGSSFTSDIAIDDVAILTGAQCDDAIATAVTPSPDIPESCTGRCTSTAAPRQRGCGCSISCINDGNCCSDFLDVCVFTPDSANTDDDDIASSTLRNASDAPRTEKLIAPPTPSTTTTTSKTTTTSTTTTTPKPTTTTPKPTTTTTTLKPTTVRTTKATTTEQKPVLKTYTPTKPVIKIYINATSATTVKPTTKSVKSTTTLRPVRFRQDVEKEKKEESIEEQTSELARKIPPEAPSGSEAVVVVLLLLVVCLVGSALFARSARGRAALARWRGRAGSDPEVRYLTQDHD